ncbi:MAG: tetratricopeptide repeat protein [Opitutales bacterium]
MLRRLSTYLLLSATAYALNEPATQRLFEIAAKEERIYKNIAADPDYYSEADIERRIIELLHAYEAYLKDTPEDVEALILYAKLLRRTGKTADAFQIFLRADELDPEVAVIKQQIGTYMAEQGKGKVALLYYQQAVELEPQNAIYHFSLGQLLFQFCEDFVAAEIYTRDALDREMIKAFTNAADRAPDNFDFQVRLGAAYYDQASPDWQAALVHWDQSRARFKETLQLEIIHLHKARVLGKLGRHEEARALADTVTSPALEKSRQQVVDEAAQF